MPLQFRIVTIVLAVVILVTASTRVVQSLSQQAAETTRYHTVAPESLRVVLVERGKLSSQSNVRVNSEVEDIKGDGILGNAILWIIENGAHVKKGDLLVTLDSGTHLERVDEQVLDTDKARAKQIEADVLYQNQISQNETLAAAAKLNLELAKLELEMFEDPNKGTLRLQVDTIDRLIDNTENEILSAKASLKLSENELAGLEQLYQFGYVGKSELDRARLDFMQAQGKVSANTNRLQTQIASVEKINVFEKKMQLLTLQGAVQTAQRTVDQVNLNNAAELSKAKTELDRADRVLEKEQQRLERYQWHLERCDIYAPQDGMVAYATPRHSRQSKVELGALIWEGQTILYLPDLTQMQVETVVHETARSWVKPGLPVTIRLESDPDREYRGSVRTVDLMPDRRNWDESDTKVYKTLVTIDETLDGMLKPGMTAIAEVHLDAVEDALTIPVDAIRYEEKTTYCHVYRRGAVERVEIHVGRSNDQMAEVRSGLSEGDVVVID